jgi:hypothetical protein
MSTSLEDALIQVTNGVALGVPDRLQLLVALVELFIVEQPHTGKQACGWALGAMRVRPVTTPDATTRLHASPMPSNPLGRFRSEHR